MGNYVLKDGCDGSRKPGEFDEKQKQTVVKYLNLCAEEYLWVQKGWIPNYIWKSWENGIKSYIDDRRIRGIFKTEKDLWKSSYYGFFDSIYVEK